MINIIQGQPSIAILFFLLFSLLLYKKKEFSISGVVLSLLLIKPQLFPIIFFLFLLIENRKFKIGAIFGSVSIFLINLIMYGKDFVTDYLKFLIFTDKPYYGSHIGASHTIKSIIELIDAVLKTDFSKYTMFISLVLIGILGLILINKREVINSRNIDIEALYGLSILISAPLTIHLLNHDLIIMALPACVIASTHKALSLKPGFWILYILTWIYYLMNISFLYNKSVIGVFIIFGFIYYYVKNLGSFSRNRT
jgi:hypothetical protein